MRVDASDLLRAGTSLEQKIEAQVRLLAIKLHSDLREATPVDTGRAQDGWEIDLSGDNPEIRNDVPYIGALNNGHSKQAPALFVEACIERAKRNGGK